MNINRYNYEEFFLLYVDNELTKAERAEVEAFVHSNPDLAEELDMLKQSMLRPEPFVQFPGKASLLKPEPAALINETNYEEFFLLYIDNELDASFRKEVEGFAASNPAFKQALDLLLQTKADPAEIIAFPDKSTLYREPAGKRVVIGWWTAVAVAAMLLLALGIFWLGNPATTGSNNPDGLATTGGKQPVNTPAVKTGGNETANPDDKNPAVEPVMVQQSGNDQQLATQQTANKANDDHQPISGNKLYAVNTAQDNDPGMEPKTAIVDAQIETGRLQRTAPALEIASLTSAVKIKSDPVVQTAMNIAQPTSFPETTADEDAIAIAPVDRKNKMRGLLRKVTRVFEKTTNLPAVEEKGLLIGGFEIALNK